MRSGTSTASRRTTTRKHRIRPGGSSPSSSRRAKLHVFPYQLWYRVDDEAEKVEIIAVLHHRQDSAEFDGRLL